MNTPVFEITEIYPESDISEQAHIDIDGKLIMSTVHKTGGPTQFFDVYLSRRSIWEWISEALFWAEIPERRMVTVEKWI